MINKESLLYIPALKLVGRIENMTEQQLNNYIQNLNLFIDEFPSVEAKLRDALNTGLATLSMNVANIGETLNKIHADDLSRQARKISEDVKKMGRDELESQLENFILSVSSLSIDIQMAARRSAPPSVAKNSFYSSNKPKILAVDNAVMFLNTLKKLLKDAPYDLHCLTSGDEALEYLKRNRPDLFLLDIEMPDMNGYMLARQIINSGQRAPIIFITANSAREYVNKAFEAGGAALLMKPLRINQLLEKIKEFI